MSKMSACKTIILMGVFCVPAAFGSPAQNEQPASNSVTFTSLFSFNGADGGGPQYGYLAQGLDGNFYGTTSAGGANGSGGTLFKITSGGTLATLYSFCAQSDCVDGTSPFQGLLQATNGALYGTTWVGGAYGDGTVFSLSVGLGQFVATLPTSARVGTTVKILGNNLKGATSVTFNGTKATFTVDSTGTAITTTVPTGATTGFVKVTTASGKVLTSNVKFRVP